ncbi:MAG: hypothetical protein HQM16_05070 [Deltaproteobacteria bacterium]|nr:hypothetical protein [Deltaproteobacteria bacterium]
MSTAVRPRGDLLKSIACGRLLRRFTPRNDEKRRFPTDTKSQQQTAGVLNDTIVCLKKIEFSRTKRGDLLGALYHKYDCVAWLTAMTQYMSKIGNYFCWSIQNFI